MTPAAFKGSYADWRLVKTRQVVQIVFEVPLSEAGAAYEVLGGMPNPAAETWFGIAPLDPGRTAGAPDQRPPPPPPPVPETPKAAVTRRDWRDLQPAQQAGIRCAEPSFVAFLREHHPEDFRALEGDAAALVRFLCRVASRAQLNTQHKARMIWHQLDQQFQAWKALERA